MSSQTINVEQIMRELKKEAESRGMSEIEGFDEAAPLELVYAQRGEPFDPDFLLNEMELANKSFAVNPDIAVEGRCRLMKRLIRKLSAFIVRQLAEDMTQYNIHIVRSMNQIRNYIVTRNSADKDVAELKSLISGDISWKIDAQSGRLRELSRENMELKKQLQELAEKGEKSSLALEKANAEIELLRVRSRLQTSQYGMLPGQKD